MAGGQYNVVFRGALTGDKPEDEVKMELAALFNASAERIEALFSGRPVVVKRHVDASTATKFRAAFQRAGAFCELVPADQEPASGAGPERKPTGEPAAQKPADSPRPDTTAPETDDTAANEQPARQSPPAAQQPPGEGDSMAAAGDPNRTVVNLAVPDDLSHLSIDDSERPHQPQEDVPPPQLDISGLSLAGDEALPGRRDQQPEREFDTSGMSLEPAPESQPRTQEE